jgi:hypothetical protein
LIVADYGGRGENLLQIAETRQALLHGIKYNGYEVTFENSEDIDASIWSDSRQPRLFAEYCFRYLGFGEPEYKVVKKCISSSSRVRFQGYLMYGWMEMSRVEGHDQQQVRKWCFMRVAQNFRQHDESLWEKFQTGELAEPQIMFKLELRNCDNIEPQIREKLTRYT